MHRLVRGLRTSQVVIDAVTDVVRSLRRLALASVAAAAAIGLLIHVLIG